MEARTQRNSLRLQLIRALRDYGDFMMQEYRSELSCMGYVWSWRCADLMTCTSDDTRSQARTGHLRHLASISATLAPNREFIDTDEKRMVTLISRRARRELRKDGGKPNVFWFLPVQLLPDVFNPAALGWQKSPRSCQVCCCCFVWCCNRMPA